MFRLDRSMSSPVIAQVLAGFLCCLGATGRADTVKLKDGTVLVGMVDKDGALVQVFDEDGLRRVVLRDSKIESITGEAPPKPERFRLVQPLTVHAGEMPPYAINVEAAPWDALGRRKFRFVGSKSGKPIEMTQALIELAPRTVKYRGIDGFWVGSLEMSQVAKPVVLGLLAKIEQKNKDERVRMVQFLIQAEWFDESKHELDRLERDFADLKENVKAARTLLLDAEARSLLGEIALRRSAKQWRDVEKRLRAFPTEGVPPDVANDVRNQMRVIAAREAEDRDLAQTIQKTADGLTEDARRALEPRLLEILKRFSEAPDAMRDRLEPFRQADRGLLQEQRLALLCSAWVAGPERASSHPETADALWNARDILKAYLVSASDQNNNRASLVEQLQAIAASNDSDKSHLLDLAILTDISARMAPPLHDDRNATAGSVRALSVSDDPNPDIPTEYAVYLPPEYHPLRSYPVFVVLHGMESPAEALDAWKGEAQRHGYILIAPEYGMPGKPPAYRYTGNEHAAVQLALRDAKRRFAIDSDRVFLTGTLEGGNMAWDFGLAHPDLFAGVAVISGFPAKYVWPGKTNAPLVPMYVVMGDLSAPTVDPVVFEQWVKPLILGNNDIRYVKMYKRGLEAFPEEIPNIFRWATSRVRNPAPKQWEAISARECDDRFFGVVVRGFSSGRTTTPEAAEPLGRNITPAKIEFRANAVLNKAVLSTTGLTAFDVWISPKLFDFSKKVEVQVGRNTYKVQLAPNDFAPYLEDLRIRGDRQQPYWLKVPVNFNGARGG